MIKNKKKPQRLSLLKQNPKKWKKEVTNNTHAKQNKKFCTIQICSTSHYLDFLLYFNAAPLQATDTDKAVHKAVSITTTIQHRYGRSLGQAFNPINKFKLRIVLLTDFNNIKAGKLIV